jgi:serine/threonine protein kinase
LASTNSSLLIQLKYAFKDPDYIYLAMEFLPGGDMKNLLDHVGCFSLDHARFYFTEMVLAVECLHRIGYIHRDLKPDNFMVDRTGHLKLIDFGLSKEGASEKTRLLAVKKDTLSRNNTLNLNTLPSRTLRKRTGRREIKKIYSIVGSPEYMAIEILKEEGYNHTVDFWSLGVIFYELLFGITPFIGESILETFQKLNEWKQFLEIPPPEDDDEDDNDVTEESDAWHLITRLINDPDMRIGTGKPPEEGIKEIKAHPFFNGVTFDNITKREDVPFHPKLDNEMDISYFRDAINEEDLESIGSSSLEDILNMPKEFTEPFSGILKNENRKKKEREGNTEQQQIEDAGIYFKNSYAQNAFAGWTFRHEDIEMLIRLKRDEKIKK